MNLVVWPNAYGVAMTRLSSTTSQRITSPTWSNHLLMTTTFVRIPLAFLLSREDVMTSVYVSSLPEDLLGVHLALEEVFGGVGTIKVPFVSQEPQSILSL